MAVKLRRAVIVRMSLASAAVAALAVVPAVTASASGTPGASAPSATQSATDSGDRQADANEALVVNFNDQLFNHFNYSYIDKYVSPSYTQHNPTVANGPDALRQLVQFLQKTFPNFHTKTVRAVAEGDLVILQNIVQLVPGGPLNANFDVYRVEGGKFVEHWDVLQSEPATAVSGNSMTSELSTPADDNAPAAVTAHDKSLVLDYLTELTQAHDLSAINQYVAPSLYQHDPTLANGSAALEQAYSKLFAQDPTYGVTIAQVAADGDLVAVHAHVRNAPSDLGQAVVYLFRVQHGKIVEQWDSVQNVPATSANSNTMF